MQTLLKLTSRQIPPSDNMVYKKRAMGKHGVGMYMTKEGKEWKDSIASVAHLLREQKEISLKPISVTISITFDTKRRCDIQNRVKLTLDALEGIIYKDDSQIMGLALVKSFGDETQMEIEVCEL